MAVSIVDELVTLLGLDLKPDTMQRIHRFEAGLESITKFAVAATASISATAASVAYFTERAVESAADLHKFSELTGQASDSLQRWTFAAEQAGGKASSVKSDIMGLVKSMNPAMPGEFNDGLFMLGMYQKKYHDIDELLLGLSDKFKTMSAGKALNWASHIGISEDTLLLLRKGRDGIKELRGQTPFLMSDDQLEQARHFEAQINKIKNSLKSAGEILSIGITPGLSKVIEKVDVWLNKNREILSSKLESFLEGVGQGFMKIGRFISKVVEWLGRSVPYLEIFVDGLTDANTIGNIVAITLGILTAALVVMGAEWIAIGAVIVAASLAMDDFCTYLEGGKSLTGDFIEYIKKLGNEFSTKFPAIAKLISVVYDGLKALGKLSLDFVLYSLKDMWATLVKIGEVFNTTLGSLAWLLNLLLTPFTSLFADDRSSTDQQNQQDVPQGQPSPRGPTQEPYTFNPQNQGASEPRSINVTVNPADNNPVGSPSTGPKQVSVYERKILSEALDKALLMFQRSAPNIVNPVVPKGTVNNSTSTHSTTTQTTTTNHNTFQIQSQDPHGVAREIGRLMPGPDYRLSTLAPVAQ